MDTDADADDDPDINDGKLHHLCCVTTNTGLTFELKIYFRQLLV